MRPDFLLISHRVKASRTIVYTMMTEDEDFALAVALSLQEEENEAVQQSGPSELEKNTPMSIIDSRWEEIDPTPDVRAMFMTFNQQFFWGRLDSCEVVWSPKMTLCAGLCRYEFRGGYCSIRLSEPLLKLRSRKDLVETLLHEMIHAYLFVTANNSDRDGHGPEFQKHMNRLNKQTGTNITIYHTFYNEVAKYKTHWWKCNGPCKDRQPYFGMVKRSMNRAPSARDPWWKQHQESCGGTFIKIKEPEDYGKKKTKPKQLKSPVKPKGVPDIRKALGRKYGMNFGKTNKPSASAGSNKNANVIRGGVIQKPSSVPAASSEKDSSGAQKRMEKETEKTCGGESSAKIVGGILSREGHNTEDRDRLPHTGLRIASLFQPIEIPEKRTQKKRDETERFHKREHTGPLKIHTISSSSGKDTKATEEFSGAGFVVGGGGQKVASVNGGPRDSVGTLVRRIPGVCLIESRRPVEIGDSFTESGYASGANTSSSTVATDRGASPALLDSDAEVDAEETFFSARAEPPESVLEEMARPEIDERANPITILSSSSQESVSPCASPSLLEEAEQWKTEVKSSSPDDQEPRPSTSKEVADTDFKLKGSSNKQIKKKNQVSMPYFSSSDEDEVLFSVRGWRSTSPSVPTCKPKTVKGVTFYYPSVGSRKSLKYKKKRVFGPQPSTSKTVPIGRSFDYSANRNNRGLGLGEDSDADETDDEEMQSLNSARQRQSSDSDPLEIQTVKEVRPGSADSILICSDSDSLPKRSESNSPCVIEMIPSPLQEVDINFGMNTFSAQKRRIESRKRSGSTASEPGIQELQMPPAKRARLNFLEKDKKPVGEAGQGGSSQRPEQRPAIPPDSPPAEVSLDTDPVVDCPSCIGRFKYSLLNDHLDQCLPDL